MPGLAWLKLDVLMYNTKRVLAEYEALAGVLAQKCIQRLGRNTEKDVQDRCVFDVLYSYSKQKEGESFSLPELTSESSLLITTGA
jgi:siderophore synthetase component